MAELSDGGGKADGFAQLCSACHYWDSEHDLVDGRLLGICRRFPPAYDGWAMTGPDDWCGEFLLHLS